MKSRVLDNIRSSKPFKKLDVLIYALVAVALIILFAVFVIFPKKSTSAGFVVLSDNLTILSHAYGTDEFTTSEAFSGSVETKKTEGGYIITIRTIDGYNTLFSDENKRTVSVIESDCSKTPDCVYMPSVSDSGVIVCVPHGISVKSLESGVFTPPTTG